MSAANSGFIGFFTPPVASAKAFYADLASKLKACAKDVPFAASVVSVVAAAILAIMAVAFMPAPLVNFLKIELLKHEYAGLGGLMAGLLAVSAFGAYGVAVDDFDIKFEGRFISKFEAVIRAAIGAAFMAAAAVFYAAIASIIICIAVTLIMSAASGAEPFAIAERIILSLSIKGAIWKVLLCVMIAAAAISALYVAGKWKIALSAVIKVYDWQKYFENNFDLNVDMPDGWTYKKGIRRNVLPIFESRFAIKTRDKKAAYSSLKEHLFALTEKTSDDGNFAMANVAHKIKGDRLDAVPRDGAWYFTTSKGTIGIDVLNKGRFALVTMAVVIAAGEEMASEFITACPNPVAKSSGAVNFYRQGKPIADGALKVYNTVSEVINKIQISDNTAGQDRRLVGSWDLKNRKGLPVPEGKYFVSGKIKTEDGDREKVLLAVDVR